MLSIDRILDYRFQTYNFDPKYRLKNKAEAVQFVNTRGYIFFWPITGINLPSLWGAVAGERPVPNEHDDPGHITWDWKEFAAWKAYLVLWKNLA